MRGLFIKTLLIYITVYLSLSISVTADPQTNLLNFGCSNYNATNPSLFLSNLNSTLADLRSQISASAGGVFSATAERSRSVSPVYALAFCRAYLSRVDCLSCLSSAAASVRTCSAGTGGRVIYDGCTLRYESAPFFDQGTLPGNTPVCANGTATTMAFASAAGGLLQDLSLDTPRVDGYFAVASREGVYAAAQCTPTVSKPVCADCLQVAYQNIKGCLPASEARAVDAGCFMRYSGKAFFPASATVNLAAFEGPDGRRKGRMADVIAGVVGGICALLFLGLAVFIWLRRQKRPEDRWRGDILGATELRGPVNFHYSDLKSATKNFSKENKLGEGGFGEVYKGTLKNGKVIAVKKLAMTQSKNAKASFLGEVKLISNVHHQNLLRLLGCSSKSDELLLVYEYMANGSLDKFLFGEMRGMLNWRQRFDIIVGMARGLAYLHQEFHVCIIHRDIKSSNILLDDNFRPKIADFGLARLRPGDQSHLSTYFAGTLGYIAPEYVIHGDLTEKVDTYSFGVVVLEIISGQRSSDSKLEPVPQYLLEWAWKLYDEDGFPKLIDKSLNPDEYILEEVVRVIIIALLCTQVVSSRPTMSEVVVLLLSQGGPELRLARPSFIETPGRLRDEITSSTGSSSVAPTTILMPKFSAR